MLLSILAFIAVCLTIAMFVTKQAMLGFPCVIFWALIGAQGYTLSIMTWDMYYFVFFASMGMAIFSAIAGFGLREKRDTIGDEEMDGSNTKTEPYIDEEKASDPFRIDSNEEPSDRTKKLRERAEKRRTREV